MAKIFSQAQMDEIYAYFKDKMNSLQCIRMVELKPFDECTPKDIADIAQAYYDGIYNLNDIQTVWNIGDEKMITLSAMGANYGLSDTHVQQNVVFRLIGIGHDTLATPINGIEKAIITLEMKDCLEKTGVMSPTSTWSGWKDLPRRSWCNDTFKNALPSDLQDAIKTVEKISIKSSTKNEFDTTNDDCFILSAFERGMYDWQSKQTGAIYDYYLPQTGGGAEPKRIKQVNDSNSGYWVRDKVSNAQNNAYHEFVRSDGAMDNDLVYSSKGLTVAFCI